MAPEGKPRETADQRTGVYAAAIIVYEILAGRLPYGGSTLRSSR